jgi:hypothetical protein
MVNTTRHFVILEFLQSIGACVGNLNATWTTTMTPSDRAAQWLIVNNTLKPNSRSLKVRLAQRYALATLWFAQAQFGQEWQWNNSSQWLTMAHECDWFGVKCNDQQFDIADRRRGQEQADLDEQTNPDTRQFVTQLRLANNALQGTIPVDLKLLTALEIVDLANNNLTGSLPESIGAWSMLTEAYVNNNQLHGTLPSTMANWTNLGKFWAAGNRLQGSIPDWMQGSWTELNKVDVSSNQLVGTLPAFLGQWTNLEMFSAFGNLLNGTIPATIGNWSSILTVDLQSNSFTGTLPDSLKKWTKIESFNVSGNMLSGAIPTSLGMKWRSIDRASFTDNMFAGSLPAGFCMLANTNHSALEVDCNEVYCSCCTNCNRTTG